MNGTRDPSLDPIRAAIKAKLGAGPRPWDHEPDRVEWERSGIQCRIRRNDSFTLCGYAGIPPGHPWHGMDGDGVGSRAEAHGGITYARERDGLLWVGFDCHHSGDYGPATAMHRRANSPLNQYESYKDLAFVTRWTELLADQILVAGRFPTCDPVLMTELVTGYLETVHPEAISLGDYLTHLLGGAP